MRYGVMLPKTISMTLVTIKEVESLSQVDSGVPWGIEHNGPRIEEIGPVDGEIWQEESDLYVHWGVL